MAAICRRTIFCRSQRNLFVSKPSISIQSPFISSRIQRRSFTSDYEVVDSNDLPPWDGRVRRRLYRYEDTEGKTNIRTDVLVIGLGVGGMKVSNLLATHARILRASRELTIFAIEPTEVTIGSGYEMQLHGGGYCDQQDMYHSREDQLENEIHWIRQKVIEVKPEENLVITDEGIQVHYHALIVAAGLYDDVGQIKGLKESVGREGLVTTQFLEHAPKTWDWVQYFYGGNAIFTCPSTLNYNAGAEQCIMYLAEEYWRRHVGTWNFDVEFNTGHQQLYPHPVFDQRLKEHCEAHSITTNYGLELTEVNAKTKTAIFRKVGTDETVTKDYSFLHVVPPQVPHSFIKNSPLADKNGYVEVHSGTLQHVKYGNVFAIGDCSSAPVDRSAAAAQRQAEIVSKNILSIFSGLDPTFIYDGYTSLLVYTGYKRLMIGEWDYSKQRIQTVDYFDQSLPSIRMFRKSKKQLISYWDKNQRCENRAVRLFRHFFPLSNTTVVRKPVRLRQPFITPSELLIEGNAKS